MHGGSSTGARTAEGLGRIAQAKTVHGRRSGAYTTDRRAMAAQSRAMRATIKQAKADLRALGRLIRMYG
jgi:hypothetical protein